MTDGGKSFNLTLCQKRKDFIIFVSGNNRESHNPVLVVNQKFKSLAGNFRRRLFFVFVDRRLFGIYRLGNALRRSFRHFRLLKGGIDRRRIFFRLRNALRRSFRFLERSVNFRSVSIKIFLVVNILRESLPGLSGRSSFYYNIFRINRRRIYRKNQCRNNGGNFFLQ